MQFTKSILLIASIVGAAQAAAFVVEDSQSAPFIVLLTLLPFRTCIYHVHIHTCAGFILASLFLSSPANPLQSRTADTC